MLITKHITEQSKELTQIEILYQRSFPDNERRPLAPLLRDSSDNSEVIAFYDGTIFCGFACLLTYQDITHIIYFCIDDTLRGKGYGSEALAAMREMKSGNRIIVDIEIENEHALNNEQRIIRKKFYLRNGYIESDVKYRWRNESYEILVCGGIISKKEFHSFWKSIDLINNKLSIY
ncbi:MAG: GNAT family N-acetyltransferase [Herbinix sp.]|nr:GNAT family N-acetyltransferase [Herbinix sp.]